MAEVTVAVGGRSYTLACRDGDEAHLRGLAATIAGRADDLTRTLGVMAEPRLLLMSALMIADELHDLRRMMPSDGAAAAARDLRLDDLADRAERLAARLDPAAALPPTAIGGAR